MPFPRRSERFVKAVPRRDRFDLLIGGPGSPTQLVLTAVYLQPAGMELIDGNILKELEEDEGVAYASPLAFGDFFDQYPIIGVTPVFLSGYSLEGRPFEAAYEAVVGADVHLEIGERFSPVHGDLGGRRSRRRGPHRIRLCSRRSPRRTGSPWDRAIVVPVEAVWDVHGLPTGQEHHAEGAAAPK